MEDKWDEEERHVGFTDKWADEDLDDVKDNWDDDDSEGETKTAVTKVEPAKKSTKQRIMEKQAKKEAELQARRDEIKKLTSEESAAEKLAHKLQLQKIQEDSDLEFAKDMMLPSKIEKEAEKSFSSIDIADSAGLVTFGKGIIAKVKSTEGLEKTLHYATYMEIFFKDLCTEVGAEELKRIISSLNTLYNDKIKTNKPTKGKKKNANKIFMEKNNVDGGREEDRFIDDLDDFI